MKSTDHQSIADRNKRIVELRIKGMTMQAISEEVGIGRTSVGNAIKTANVTRGSSISDQRDKQIVEKYLAGMSTPDISKQLNVCRETVRSALKTAGAVAQRKKQLISQVIHLRSVGMSLYEIVDKVGITRPTVTKILKAEGLDTKNIRINNPNKNSFRHKQVIDLYNQGNSLQTISDKVGYVIATVRNVIRKSGIELTDNRKITKHNKSIIDLNNQDKFNNKAINSITVEAGNNGRTEDLSSNIQHILALHRQQMTVKAIAKEVNLSRSDVIKILNKENEIEISTCGVTGFFGHENEGNIVSMSRDTSAAPEIKHWSASIKKEVVLQLLRGVSVDTISRELGIENYRLEEWHQKALQGIESALQT